MLPTPKLRCLLVCMIALFCSGSLAAETLRNPVRIPLPVDPAMIAAGDLNGDGRPDFVWEDTSTSPTTLHVLLAQPGGGYLPGQTITYPITTSRAPVCILSDVNNDGFQDLVCASADLNQAVFVHAYLGNGNGTFQAPIATEQPASLYVNGSVPLIFAAGDLNGDGFPDILIDHPFEGIDVLLSDGKGGFKAPISTLSGFTNYAAPVIADVNGDGIPDILWPIGPEVALGNGDGSFQPPVNYLSFDNYLATCVFHDMDGDGHLDAVCGYDDAVGGDIVGSTDLIIFHGNPDGTFNISSPIATKTFGDHINEFDGFGTFQTPIAVTDLNRDGILDILFTSGDGIGVLLGGSGLTYSTPLHYAQSVVAVFPSAVTIYQALILDVNGDGLLDSVTAGPHGIYIAYGKSDGSLQSALAPEVAEVAGLQTVADFNGDGIPDIVSTGDAAIKMSLGRGDGTFDSPYAISSSNGPITFSGIGAPPVIHGDFNGDGKVDLMAVGSSSDPLSNQGPAVYILFGKGDGTFQTPLMVPSGSAIGTTSIIDDTTVFDINHDGRSDILSYTAPTYAGAQPQITFAISNGDGSFKSVATSVPTDTRDGTLSSITEPALADFNSDGKLDAVYGSLANAYVVNGHGDGTFSSNSTALPIPALATLPPQYTESVAVGDFDGDGLQDFVVLEQYSTGLSIYSPHPNATAAWIYFGNGNGTFSAPVLAGAFDHNYEKVATADLNQDGLSDIILRNEASFEFAVGVVHALPNRSFGPEVNYTAGNSIFSMEISDLNRDGFPDLIFDNAFPGYGFGTASSVTILLNEGNTPALTGTLTASPEPSGVGSPFAITATLVPPGTGAPPVGNIAFSIDGTSLGSAALKNNAAVIAGPTNLSAGTHTLGAYWAGDSTYPALTLSGTHVVIAVSLALALKSDPNPSAHGQNVTFTTTFTPGHPPTQGYQFIGTLSLYDGSTLLAQLQPSTSGYSFNIATLSVGSHNITAVYSGDSTFEAATSNVVMQKVNGLPTTTTVAVTPEPSTYGQLVTFSTHVTPSTPTSLIPTGTVVLTFCRGATINLGQIDAHGNASVSTQIPEPVSSCPFTGQYSGDTTFDPSTSALTPYVVNPAPSMTTLSASPTTAYVSQPVSFTVQVTGMSSPGVDPITGEPISRGPLHFSGTVQLFEGTSAITPPAPITATSASTAQTVITVSTLAPGSHIITATYSNDPNLGGSTSPSITEVILASDFTFTGPASVTFRTEATGKGTLLLGSLYGFAGPIALTCNPPLPSNYLCTLSPATVTLPANGGASSTIILQPNLRSSIPAASSTHTPRILLATFFPLALLACCRPKRNRRLRSRLTALLSLALLTMVTSAITACGPDIFYAATPPGTYPITITATGTAQGTSTPITHTLPLNIVITP